MENNPLIYVALETGLFEQLGLSRYIPQWERYAVVERWTGPYLPSVEAVQDAARRAEVLVTGWGTPPLKETLREWSPENSPLRLIAHTAGTVKFLLPINAIERGLRVTHANDAIAEAVAEFTLGAMIAARRQMFLSAAHYQAHRPAPPYFTMRELPGSTIGIIGASAIGRRVMALLRPWNVKFLLYDPYTSAEDAAQLGAERVELLELFTRSDIVSLHAPITPETVGMVRAEHFRAMKNGALFINTARGVLVDHSALLSELRTGRIYALLDVTDPVEPLPENSPFFNLENCVLIPHQAGTSLEARLRQGQMTGEDVLAYLEGRPLPNEIKLDRWQTMA